MTTSPASQMSFGKAVWTLLVNSVVYFKQFIPGFWKKRFLTLKDQYQTLQLQYVSSQHLLHDAYLTNKQLCDRQVKIHDLILEYEWSNPHTPDQCSICKLPKGHMHAVDCFFTRYAMLVMPEGEIRTVVADTTQLTKVQ